MTEKSRENKARRNLLKQGYMMKKSRTRFTNGDDYGGYMIYDFNNFIVAGEKFDLSLEDVEKFIAEPD